MQSIRTTRVFILLFAVVQAAVVALIGISGVIHGDAEATSPVLWAAIALDISVSVAVFITIYLCLQDMALIIGQHAHNENESSHFLHENRSEPFRFIAIFKFATVLAIMMLDAGIVRETIQQTILAIFMIVFLLYELHKLDETMQMHIGRATDNTGSRVWHSKIVT